MQDLFLNETAARARLSRPRSSKDGTFTNAGAAHQPASARSPRSRHGPTGRSPAFAEALWLSDALLASSEIMAEIAPHPHLHGRQLREAGPPRHHSVAVHRRGARGHAHDARRRSLFRGKAAMPHGSTSPRRSARHASTHSSSRRAASSASNNVGAQTRRRTSRGTPRTSSRSTLPTPSSAASALAIAWS